ncbi:CU044_2847 family protein [Kitasatospora sp. NPDC004240]
MGDTVELKLADGTGVLLEVVGGPPQIAAAPASAPAGLPAGTAPVVPVGAGRARRAVEATGQALADVLRPLGGVLDSVHSAVSSAVRPPDEISVELGIKLSHDLKLGITSAAGEATITVRATWTPGARGADTTTTGADAAVPRPAPAGR